MARLNATLGATLQSLLVLLALIWAVDLPTRLGLQIFTEQLLAVSLGLGVAAALMSSDWLGDRAGANAARFAAGIVALAAALFITIDYPTLALMIAARPLDATAASLALVGATLVALRVSSGWGIVVVVLAFILYALTAHLLPGELQSRQISLQRLVLYLGIDANGILGVALKVACTIVIPYVFFGALLTRFGAADFFTDLAAASMGRFRGGSAKIAITASALFGTISGSAVGNVVATGVVTIPLMKKGGYEPKEAGAIEAVASTGGQLVPPVMGATAFLMAEFLQIPYREVVLAALFPAFLYYFTLFVQVDLLAAKRGLRGLQPHEIPRLSVTMRQGWHFLLPFAALIWGLFVQNMRPETAAILASAVLIAVGLTFGYKGQRPNVPTLLRSVVEAGAGSKEILIVTAGAGIVIGVLNVTGVAFGLTSQLVNASGGNVVMLLIMCAAINIVLGMGMPTVGVYVLLATLIAPSLVKLGVPEIGAHLFILYFGLMSMVTPPVALASFAGANVAKADPWATSWTAMKLGWCAYIVPFLFVASPSLMLIGDPIEVAHAVVTAAIGCTAATIGVTGFWRAPLSIPMRAVAVVAGVAAMVPATAFTGAWLVEALGLAALAIAGVVLWRAGAAQAVKPELGAPGPSSTSADTSHR